MQEFLTQRPSLKVVFVLVDWSIQPQTIDFEFMKVLKEDQIPFEIIITKTDKSNQKDLYKNTIALQNMYEKYFWNKPNFIMTSSIKGRGKDNLLDKIEKILQ